MEPLERRLTEVELQVGIASRRVGPGYRALPTQEYCQAAEKIL
jgi:hypothetical protein